MEMQATDALIISYNCNIMLNYHTVHWQSIA